MATLNTTTELEAVNTMLQTIGESSVTTLAGTLPYEVAVAQTILKEVAREICMDSFVFNTEEDRVLTADGSGNYSATTPQDYVQIPELYDNQQKNSNQNNLEIH